MKLNVTNKATGNQGKNKFVVGSFSGYHDHRYYP